MWHRIDTKRLNFDWNPDMTDCPAVCLAVTCSVQQTVKDCGLWPEFLWQSVSHYSFCTHTPSCRKCYLKRGLGLPTSVFSILGHTRTIEGLKAPIKLLERQLEGSGRGVIASHRHGGPGQCPRKIFEISVAESRILMHFASNITEYECSMLSLKIFCFWLLVRLVNNVMSCFV